MENKINIAEILKDCPKGMELDCLICEDVYFDYVDELNIIHCYIQHETCKASLTFNQYGIYNSGIKAKCVIFPKGKTTWEGFVPPCQLEDGKIVATNNGLFIGIIKVKNNRQVGAYCSIDYSEDFRINSDYWFDRMATEEEKQKLFNVIKDNGYEWNPETKTLEKLIEPKEEPIEDKGNISDGYHTFNELYEYRLLYNASMFNELAKQGLYDVHKSKRHSDGTIPFGDENWFIVQAELPTGQISNHYEIKDWDLFQVPEKEKANTYDGHTPQDVAKRLREFLTPKPKYPETYIECAKSLECFGAAHIDGYKCELLEKLQELLICRDAYWKIAGVEMGLGKPWEPDWNNCAQHKFGLYTLENEIRCINLQVLKNIILVFPTEEMRDAFYENFNELIVNCKELL